MANEAEPVPLDYKAAVARLQELFGVPERVADAILTIAASGIGSYTRDGYQVYQAINDDGGSVQKWRIEKVVLGWHHLI